MISTEIWFLCKQYSAKEAEEMGMVNKVVPLEKLEDRGGGPSALSGVEGEGYSCRIAS